MEKYLFIAPILDRLSDGRFLRSLVSWGYWGLAVIFAIGGFFAWIKAWKIVSQLKGFAVLGGSLFQALFVIGIYMIVHVLIIRSSEISKLSTSDFVLIRILAVFYKTLGDTCACAVSILGIGGAIFSLTGEGGELLHVFVGNLPGLSAINSFIQLLYLGGNNRLPDAITYLVSAGISALASVVFFYMLAEVTLLFADIARNVRVLRIVSEKTINT